MADGNISQIVLPNGNIYDIKDETARAMDLTATYNSSTYDLEFSFGPIPNADNEEFQR